MREAEPGKRTKHTRVVGCSGKRSRRQDSILRVRGATTLLTSNSKTSYKSLTALEITHLYYIGHSLCVLYTPIYIVLFTITIPLSIDHD